MLIVTTIVQSKLQVLMENQGSGVGVYIQDPTDSSRYCLKKQQGSYTPIMLFDGTILRDGSTTLYKMLHESNDATFSFPHANYVWSFDYDIEFDYYKINSTNSTYHDCILDGTGQCNQNTNARNTGVAILSNNNQLKVVYRTPASSTFYYYTLIGSVYNKWYHLTFSPRIVDDNYYNVTVTCTDILTEELVTWTSPNLPRGSSNNNNRGGYSFFSDTWGYGSWAENSYDYLKDLRLYKVFNISP